MRRQFVNQARVRGDDTVVGLGSRAVILIDTGLIDLRVVIVGVPAGTPTEDQGQRVGQLDAPGTVDTFLHDRVLAVGTRATGRQAVVVLEGQVVVEIENVRPRAAHHRHGVVAGEA
ncbi:hypothetical protein D9M71_681030 [compost metagenome]